jgi:hypothetical protein
MKIRLVVLGVLICGRTDVVKLIGALLQLLVA